MCSKICDYACTRTSLQLQLHYSARDALKEDIKRAHSIEERVQAARALRDNDKWAKLSTTQNRLGHGQTTAHEQPGQFSVEVCHIGIMLAVRVVVDGVEARPLQLR